jgi:CRISPR/Cas system CSM-associated protein Csm3 (group 7 of RAMP superfamily)
MIWRFIAMSPYDFVRIPENSTCTRQNNIIKHNKLGVELYHGSMECNIENLTPLFIPARIPETQGHKTLQFFGTDKRGGVPKIPGTSLKGVIRSISEAVANSCFCIGKQPPEIDDSFKPCEDNDSLCITCRIFGMMKGGLLKGKISIGDATIKDRNYKIMEQENLKPLFSPQSENNSLYIPGGRKFYFHHTVLTDPKKCSHWKDKQKRDNNSTVSPLEPGANFKFLIDFTNLTNEELSLLLHSLTLEPSMRHKIGYAKPLGLGSVHITIKKLELFDPLERYGTQPRTTTEYTGDELEDFIGSKTVGYINNSSTNLQDLRRILNWDPQNKTLYEYPTRK